MHPEKWFARIGGWPPPKLPCVSLRLPLACVALPAWRRLGRSSTVARRPRSPDRHPRARLPLAYDQPPSTRARPPPVDDRPPPAKDRPQPGRISPMPSRQRWPAPQPLPVIPKFRGHRIWGAFPNSVLGGVAEFCSIPGANGPMPRGKRTAAAAILHERPTDAQAP